MKNSQHLSSLNAGEVLIKLCCSLPTLNKYIQQWKSIRGRAGEEVDTEVDILLNVPNTNNDAATVRAR